MDIRNRAFVYKGVLVIWDDDRDERVLELLNQMDTDKGPLGERLASVHESEGFVDFRWRSNTEEHESPVPPNYSEGDDVNVLCDSWCVDHSRQLGAEVCAVDDLIKTTLTGLGSLTAYPETRAPRIVLDSLDHESLTHLFCSMPLDGYRDKSLLQSLHLAESAYGLYKSAEIIRHAAKEEHHTGNANGFITGLASRACDDALKHFKELELLASEGLDAKFMAHIARIGAGSGVRQ